MYTRPTKYNDEKMCPGYWESTPAWGEYGIGGIRGSFPRRVILINQQVDPNQMVGGKDAPSKDARTRARTAISLFPYDLKDKQYHQREE